jgi:hypothetical protein
MEYIPGVSLESLLQAARILSVEQTNRLLIPLCRALTAGHARRIVHRDLKPANLMVTGADSNQLSLKVMDFGLALINAKPHIPLDKLRGSGKQAATFGTPIYVAPDGLRGSVTDHRVDIYSVGVILFEMLVGAPPFNHHDTLAILNAHVNVRPPRFSSVRPNHTISREVEAVVQRCLEKYPNERPQTAREIAEEFGHAIGCPLTDEAFPPNEGRVDAPATRPAAPAVAPAGKYRVVHTLDAWMPEPIAVVKLRGFVEDKGGVVRDSQPGEIRVQLGRPAEPAPPAGRGKSLMSWVGGRLNGPAPAPAAQADPIDMRLFLSRASDDRSNRLQLMIVFEPLDGRALSHPTAWRDRCDTLFHDLRGYLMGK